jgi:radical SAM protein with 4Fe4S-binding SPASM domain
VKTIQSARSINGAETDFSRKKRTGFVTADVGGPISWDARYARLEGAETGGGYWICDEGPLNVQLLSSEFRLEKGQLYTFDLEVDIRYAAPLGLVLISAEADAAVPDNWLRQREVLSAGNHHLVFSYAPSSMGMFRVALINYFGAYSRGSELKVMQLTVLAAPYVVDEDILDVDTYLPGWGPVKRFLHRRCKRSRFFNAFVASMEMRLGREESISLPMYLALCPTGQCNALCDFCSVTIKRTGIIKKQLPFDKVQRFIAPTLNTAYMYGIEGNGEPTIYREFNSLLVTLQKKGAASYLITNGALIEPEQIPHLLSLQSITFSLNAATAETHRKVMKLKEFDRVANSIRTIIDRREGKDTPTVFVSFVVHETNAHELQSFLQFAEYDLRVDVIVIRPLSELGADIGAVEDLRDIVPYESQINDALDAAREYLEDVPRRQIPYTKNICDIRLDPSTFRSVRPDPVDRVVLPPGFEGRLLAPRRDGWHCSDPLMSVVWKLNQATVRCPEGSGANCVWRSVFTPVEPGARLVFRANILLEGAPLDLSILSGTGTILGAVSIEPSPIEQKVELVFDTGQESSASLAISCTGQCVAAIDFIRVMRPGSGMHKSFKLPFPRRWQIDSPGTRASWEGNRLNISTKENRAGRYLFKSYSSPCLPDTRLTLPIKIAVESGKLVIGLLSEDFQKWTHQFTFDVGHHEQDLIIDTGDNHRLQVVLFARDNTALNAHIDWGDTLEPAPDRETIGKALIDMPIVADAPKSSGERTASPVDDSKAPGEVDAAQRQKKVRFYCQKPWTDINNFTVDGRMDVCCIATGPSQEHYSLGNIFEQDFQQIWNGEKMRQFRRTVNSAAPLPPCQRCPMAYSYQGPFFDRGVADAGVDHFVGENSPAGRHPLRRFAAAVAGKFKDQAVEFLFQGFKR